MVMFTLKNEQREHLKILREKSTDTVVDLCKLALDYLTNGPNEKKYGVTARKLNITTNNVLTTIEALVCLLIDAIKSNVTETEFDELKTFGFSTDHISILWQFVSSKKSFVENALKLADVKEYRYRDIDWRFEGKIASRSLLYQAVPIITIKFYLDSEPIPENRSILNFAIKNDQNKMDKMDEQQQQQQQQQKQQQQQQQLNITKYNTKYEAVVEIDPNNLIYLINVLEQALLESKAHRTRNILKAL